MKKYLMALPALLYTAAIWAQEAESEVDADMPVANTAWYASPWVWVLGAAVFILVLVSLTKKSNRN